MVVSKVAIGTAKLATVSLDAIFLAARDDSKGKVREIARRLSQDLTKGARYFAIADLLGMRPPQTGARRIRSIWRGDAGPAVVLDFLHRFDAWQQCLAERELRELIARRDLREGEGGERDIHRMARLVRKPA